MKCKDKRVFTEVLNLGQSLEAPCNWASVGQNRFVEVRWSREEWVMCRKSEGGVEAGWKACSMAEYSVTEREQQKGRSKGLV